MFIGSSSEAYDRVARRLAIAIKRLFGETIDVRVWKDIFPLGTFYLPDLVEEAKQSHFGVFIFARDDEAVVRGKDKSITRGNVLLEAGMFLSQLPFSRIAFVSERGVEIPTDLEGVVRVPFELSQGLNDQHAIEEVAVKLHEEWSSFNVGDSGFGEAISIARSKNAAVQGQLLAAGSSPITWESSWCQDAYTGALKRVQQRFWTTTFLTSEFWNSQALAVMSANREMLARIKRNKEASAKRIFLLPSSDTDFFKAEQDNMESYRRRGQTKEISDRLDAIELLKRNIMALQSDGCEVRAAFDRDGHEWRQLPQELRNGQDPRDTELALFDEFRLDLYKGGEVGVLAHMVGYHEGMKDFAEYRRAGETYFDRLWASGQDIIEFLDSWRHNIIVAQERINYHPNWLARYDYKLTQRDARLKTEEFRLASSFVREQTAKRPIKKYLDIGTCTGRYPFGLLTEKILSPEVEIVALDSDYDCTRHVQEKRAELQDSGVIDATNLRVEHEDFLLWSAEAGNRHFDLVTCMLGTISHFGMRRSDREENDIENAIAAIADVLAPGGGVAIGSWSPTAVATEDFLDIYRSDDAKVLARWTPPRARLEAVMKAHGLELRRFGVQNRIDLYLGRKCADAKS